MSDNRLAATSAPAKPSAAKPTKSTTRRKTARPIAPQPPGSIMNARLALLSDDEIDRLRSRIIQLTRMGTPEQRQTSADQLEAIDIERERRLSPPPA
jgi:hypothetical protein